MFSNLIHPDSTSYNPTVMITTEQILLYRTLFHGRQDIYARYWEKNGKHGYFPAYKFDWQEFLAHKAKGGTIATFEHKTSNPLTLDILHAHLEGSKAVDISVTD